MKNGKKRTKSIGQLLERPSTSESEAAGSGSHEEAMAKAAESFAQSWLDQSLPLGLPNQQSSPEGDGSSSTRVAGTSQARETVRTALNVIVLSAYLVGKEFFKDFNDLMIYEVSFCTS